jgi:hypothetical protein
MTAVWDQAIREIRTARENASLDAPVVASDENLPALLTALYDLRNERKELAEIESYLERHATTLARQMKIKKGEVPGVGAFEVRGGKDRKEWDHVGLSSAVVDRHLEAVGGEVEPKAIAHALLEAAAVSYWRVTKLKELDIPADEYCSSSPGRSTVQFS